MPRLQALAAIFIALASALLAGCSAGVAPQAGVGAGLSVTRAATPAASGAASSATTAPPSPGFTPTRIPSPTVTPTPMPLIAIDAGHGGADIGAVRLDARGRVELVESAINLDLALRVRDLLVARGYRVVMTRETDVSLNPDEEDINDDGIIDMVDDLQARVDLVNAAGADLMLSIHQNSYASWGSVQHIGGVVTYYCADRPFADASLRLAQLVQSAIVTTFQDVGYDIEDRGAQDGADLVIPGARGRHLVLLGPVSLRIARASEMPAALSETAFMSNREEARLLADPAVRRRLAQAYVEALVAYFATDAPPTRQPLATVQP